jgi:hypothetical protein
MARLFNPNNKENTVQHTLSSSLFLYKVHRNRYHYLTAMERRKAFWLFCTLGALVTVAVYFSIFSVMP